MKFKLVIAIILTAISPIIFVLAAMERGTLALGGEIFFPLAAVAIAVWALSNPKPKK